MRMQHMEALCFNLSVAKKTLLMLFPTLIAVNRSTDCRLCLYFRHICTDTHRQNEKKKRKKTTATRLRGLPPSVHCSAYVALYGATARGRCAVHFCSFGKQHNECNFQCVCRLCACLCVCVFLLSVWERVCSQVPAMGFVVVVGGLLACTADN